MKWLILLAYGLVLWVLSPWSNDRESFYRGTDSGGQEVGFWLLTASIFISWVFAKSVTNAANLGARYGMTGGLAYAAWYLSIPIAGLVIWGLRHHWQVDSFSEFLVSKYGKLAALTFLLAIFIRLFNEIWSNTMVVGTYFGPKASFSYYLACFLFTAVTLAYSLRGGLRSSILTDGIQALLMVFFLSLVLGFILPGRERELVSAGRFSMQGGLDLLFVGMLQSLSYPFHDPVLTDRGFLTDRTTTLKSFLAAGCLGIAAILLFSLVGVYAFLQGMTILDDAPPQVASSFGATVMVMMNMIMLSSAGSTIDSTFSSLAREVAMDLPRLSDWFARGSLVTGRWVMVSMAILGNLPLFTGATILQATTLSGTMVMGLGPVFLLFWWDRAGPLSFHLAFWFGLGLGLFDLFLPVPAYLTVGAGDYAGLLGLNLYGFLGCFGLFVLGAWLPRWKPITTLRHRLSR